MAISPARAAAREQQVGDVGAGDEQHERRDAKQEAERRLRLVRNRALPASARREEDGLRAKTRHRLRAHVLLQRRFDIIDDGVVLRAKRRARGFDGDPRPQAREQVRPIVGPERPTGLGVQHRAQRDRDEHGWPHPDRRAVEALRSNANDREALAVDDYLLVEDGWIEAESRRPIVVAEHHHARLADDVVVIRIEQSSQRGLQLQHRKIAARHEEAFAARRLRLVREVCAEADVRRDVREHGLDLLQVSEHGIAEDDIAVAGAAAAPKARLRTGRAQVHEFRRIANRERLQQHLMEH